MRPLKFPLLKNKLKQLKLAFDFYDDDDVDLKRQNQIIYFK